MKKNKIRNIAILTMGIGVLLGGAINVAAEGMLPPLTPRQDYINTYEEEDNTTSYLPPLTPNKEIEVKGKKHEHNNCKDSSQNAMNHVYKKFTHYNILGAFDDIKDEFYGSLSDEQKELFDKAYPNLTEEHKDKILDMSKEERKAYREELKSSREEFIVSLSDEQKAEFISMLDMLFSSLGDKYDKSSRDKLEEQIEDKEEFYDALTEDQQEMYDEISEEYKTREELEEMSKDEREEYFDSMKEKKDEFMNSLTDEQKLEYFHMLL